MYPNRILALTCCCALGACFCWVLLAHSRSIVIYLKSDDFENKFILTNLGKVKYSTIENEVYKRLGFETAKYSEPIATVRRIKEETCDTVFKDWLEVAATYDPKKKPVPEIPADKYDLFTLFHHASVSKLYFDERSDKQGPIRWSEKDVNSRVNSSTIATTAYSGEGEGIYHATNRYRLNGMAGIVIGSLSPWVEAYCLRTGAKKVTTIEYRQIISEHPKVDYYHPVEMAKNWKRFAGTFDFAATFSSIEHSGLGRFGDALDPFGDLREMQKIRCLLKKDGYAFIGIPSGADAIYFNAHRFYGRLRLPMMFEGFKLLNVFHSNVSTPHELKMEYFDGVGGNQLVFVLQKSDS